MASQAAALLSPCPAAARPAGSVRFVVHAGAAELQEAAIQSDESRIDLDAKVDVSLKDVTPLQVIQLLQSASR